MSQGTVSSNILNLVNETLELPTIPGVLMKLNEVMAAPDSSVEEVARVISMDPAVSANILRIVNSAYYGLQVRVSNINRAVSIMGFNMTKKVALKAAVFSMFSDSKEGLKHFDFQGFWRHAVFTGIAAKVLGGSSPRFTGTNAEDLYICGLLHDVGKIILLERARELYGDLLAQAAQTGRPEVELETELLGYSHADVGSVLAIKWFLPEDLAIAIRYHHCPSKDPFHRSLSSLIHLADHLAWSAGNPSTKGLPAPRIDVQAYDQVGLGATQVEDLLPQIREDFEATALPF